MENPSLEGCTNEETQHSCYYFGNNYTDHSLLANSIDIRTVGSQYQVQSADSEKSLILSQFAKNTTKLLWAIFEMEDASAQPKTLNYKIRSSEIGNSRMIMMHDEEPSNEGALFSFLKIPCTKESRHDHYPVQIN
ncbi:hypothetical protein KPH14_003775 [Odynerus spinipes]|uniref:Uncharacterized protein n=1 Tax=Odynerus spinipes TaxID=1348599 RepID=A0AAD9VUM6_9HYME|nr:hypothetical protein KPH14_003775 [Odynerus spinipes]